MTPAYGPDNPPSGAWSDAAVEAERSAYLTARLEAVRSAAVRLADAVEALVGSEPSRESKNSPSMLRLYAALASFRRVSEGTE